MFVFAGFTFMFICILGAYAFHGGHLLVLWQPSELIIIFGGAIGAAVAGYGGAPLKATVKAIPSIFKKTPYDKAFYIELLSIIFEFLSKIRREGLMSIEKDIEEPMLSQIFQKYPKIIGQHHVVNFLCDYLRLMVSGSLNPFEIENLMDVEIETHEADAHIPPSVLSKIADSLPAFGIVAAVMGVVHTMGSLHLPPSALGQLIGAALVGTFTGIWLSYGFVAPLASSLESKAQEGFQALNTIKVSLISSLNGYAPQISVEFGRKAVPGHIRPEFRELEEIVKSIKVAKG